MAKSQKERRELRMLALATEHTIKKLQGRNEQFNGRN